MSPVPPPRPQRPQRLSMQATPTATPLASPVTPTAVLRGGFRLSSINLPKGQDTVLAALLDHDMDTSTETVVVHSHPDQDIKSAKRKVEASTATTPTATPVPRTMELPYMVKAEALAQALSREQQQAHYAPPPPPPLDPIRRNEHSSKTPRLQNSSNNNELEHQSQHHHHHQPVDKIFSTASDLMGAVMGAHGRNMIIGPCTCRSCTVGLLVAVLLMTTGRVDQLRERANKSSPTFSGVAGGANTGTVAGLNEAAAKLREVVAIMARLKVQDSECTLGQVAADLRFVIALPNVRVDYIRPAVAAPTAPSSVAIAADTTGDPSEHHRGNSAPLSRSASAESESSTSSSMSTSACLSRSAGYSRPPSTSSRSASIASTMRTDDSAWPTTPTSTACETPQLRLTPSWGAKERESTDSARPFSPLQLPPAKPPSRLLVQSRQPSGPRPQTAVGSPLFDTAGPGAGAGAVSGQTGPGLCDRQMRAELAAAKLEMEVLRAERDKLQTKVVDLSGRLAFTEKCLYAREQIDGY